MARGNDQSLRSSVKRRNDKGVGEQEPDGRLEMVTRWWSPRVRGFSSEGMRMDELCWQARGFDNHLLYGDHTVGE